MGGGRAGVGGEGGGGVVGEACVPVFVWVSLCVLRGGGAL